MPDAFKSHWMHHATRPSVLVHDPKDQADFHKQGFEDEYKHERHFKPFPAVANHPKKAAVVVDSQAAFDELKKKDKKWSLEPIPKPAEPADDEAVA